MTAIEILNRAQIGDYTRQLDDDSAIPHLGPLELEEFLGLLSQSQYTELQGVHMIRPINPGDLSVRSLVNLLTNGNQARLQALREKQAVAGPYLGYDENNQRVQRDGITIYARTEE